MCAPLQVYVVISIISVIKYLINMFSTIHVKEVSNPSDLYLKVLSERHGYMALAVKILFIIIFGYLIQLIVRLWFTFNYKNTINLIGPIFGGISSSVISYFLLIKGLKGSSIITELQKYL